MAADQQLSLDEVRQTALRALIAVGVAEAIAEVMAESVVLAEAEGLRSHGLARLPAYCEHVRCGKVMANAVPSLEQTGPGVLRVDANSGFAHPAIALALPRLVEMAGRAGIAAVSIHRSYNCGVAGHHVEWLAQRGLIALAFVNAPASIAPWGGIKAVFGTNPFAFAAPRRNGHTLVIDQSSSVVARGEILLRAQAKQALPAGWAIDAQGAPTTDPGAALSGSLLPAGGYKGAGQALAVELLAAALTGATLAIHASSFGDNVGGPPGTGQLFIAMDPRSFGGSESFLDSIEALAAAIEEQPGARLPGSQRAQARKRTEREGVSVPMSLLNRILPAP